MQTLKTLVVLGVLGIVGYGLYVGLNNGFEFAHVPPQTPDWIEQQISNSSGGDPTPPTIDFGTAEGSTSNPPSSFSPACASRPEYIGDTAKWLSISAIDNESSRCPISGGPRQSAGHPGRHRPDAASLRHGRRRLRHVSIRNQHVPAWLTPDDFLGRFNALGRFNNAATDRPHGRHHGRGTRPIPDRSACGN